MALMQSWSYNFKKDKSIYILIFWLSQFKISYFDHVLDIWLFYMIDVLCNLIGDGDSIIIEGKFIITSPHYE